jgi:hypothetical protein
LGCRYLHLNWANRIVVRRDGIDLSRTDVFDIGGLPIVTDPPSSEMGRLPPEKSEDVHAREELPKPVPAIETNPPDALAG